MEHAYALTSNVGFPSQTVPNGFRLKYTNSIDQVIWFSFHCFQAGIICFAIFNFRTIHHENYWKLCPVRDGHLSSLRILPMSILPVLFTWHVVECFHSSGDSLLSDVLCSFDGKSKLFQIKNEKNLSKQKHCMSDCADKSVDVFASFSNHTSHSFSYFVYKWGFWKKLIILLWSEMLQRLFHSFACNLYLNDVLSFVWFPKALQLWW